MKSKLFLTMLVVFPVLFMNAAQKHKPHVQKQCMDTAITQYDLNQCASRNSHDAESEMKRQYEVVLRKYADDPKFISNFKESQDEWVKYRDAMLKVKYPHADEALSQYGSVFPMCYSLYRERLTTERIKAINEWAKGTIEGDVCSGSVLNSEFLKTVK